MYLKLFEEHSRVIQQPFYLFGDVMYVSDDFAKFITKDCKDYNKISNLEFFDDIKRTINSKKFGSWETYKQDFASTDFYVRYGGNSMTILVKRIGTYENNKNNCGEFNYYITGISGDFTMHGKNMLRKTRECNKNLIIKYFPVWEFIRRNMQRLKEEPFFEIIEKTLMKNPRLTELFGDFKYNPKELEYYPNIEMIINSNKFNL